MRPDDHFTLRTPRGGGLLKFTLHRGRPNTMVVEIVDAKNGPRAYTFGEFWYHTTKSGRPQFATTPDVEARSTKYRSKKIRLRFVKMMWARVCEEDRSGRECSKFVRVYPR